MIDNEGCCKALVRCKVVFSDDEVLLIGCTFGLRAALGPSDELKEMVEDETMTCTFEPGVGEFSVFDIDFVEDEDL